MEKQILPRGGNREGAGRKPIDDKKIQVAVYIKRSDVDKLGGISATRQMATDFIEDTAATFKAKPAPKTKPKKTRHV